MFYKYVLPSWIYILLVCRCWLQRFLVVCCWLLLCSVLLFGCIVLGCLVVVVVLVGLFFCCVGVWEVKNRGPKSRKNGPRVWAFCKIEFPGIQKPVQIFDRKWRFFRNPGNRGVGVIWLVLWGVLDFGLVWFGVCWLFVFCFDSTLVCFVMWMVCFNVFVFGWAG